MAQLVIAYAPLQAARAYEVARVLETAGFAVWFDPDPSWDELPPWVEAMLHSAFALVVIDGAAGTGPAVDTVRALAEERGLPLIPVSAAGEIGFDLLARVWQAAEKLCAAVPLVDGAPYSVRAACGALCDLDGGVRVAAVATLAGSQHPAGRAALIAALDHPIFADVRRAAADLLGRQGGPDAIAALVEALGDLDDGVVLAAQAALERSGPRAIPALTAALARDDRMLRRAAVLALATIGTAEAVPGLISVLGLHDWFVSRTAATALGRIGDARAVPGLAAALASEDDHLRDLAAEALTRIGTPEALAAVHAVRP